MASRSLIVHYQHFRETYNFHLLP